MSFALHLHRGLSEKPIEEMRRVDSLIDASGVGPDDLVDVLLFRDGPKWLKKRRIFTIWNGYIYFCPEGFHPTEEERTHPHSAYHKHKIKRAESFPCNRTIMEIKKHEP